MSIYLPTCKKIKAVTINTSDVLLTCNCTCTCTHVHVCINLQDRVKGYIGSYCKFATIYNVHVM